MSQNILIVVFGHSNNIKTLLVSTGKSHDILNTSQVYTFTDDATLLRSFDQSIEETLSSSSQRSNLIALVLPYTWIDSDGKINKTKNRSITGLCQKHKLKPLGFISSDEAVLDYFNQEQGVPSSPVLIDLSVNKIIVSLSDMGIIKKRLAQDIDSQDNMPQICENLIIKLKDDFPITPKIFVWGDFTHQTVLDFNNYTWVDKDKKDLFLHLPDIVFFDQNQIDNIFLDTINSQLIKDDTFVSDPISPPVQPKQDQVVSANLNKVGPSDLGFSSTLTQPTPTSSVVPDSPVVDQPKTPPSLSPSPARKKINFKLPRIKLPTKWFYFIPLLLIIVPIFLFVFLYKVNIDVFITPLDINLVKQIEIDTEAITSSLGQNIIAVKREENKIILQDQANTTGSITIGEEAQGKVIVFNKTDQAISLIKGQILNTDSGISFQLLNDIEIDASSLDLDQGLISMGRTVAASEAVNIGQQGNIVEGTNLFIDDFSESQLIARVEESFAGGSSRQVQSVAEEDQQTLEDRLKQEIDQSLSQNQPDQDNQYILISTIQTEQSNIEYNREIGEQADSLEATIEAVISYNSLYPDEIAAIVDFVSKSANSDQPIDLANSQINFDFVPSHQGDLKGDLHIGGKAIPLIDLADIQQQLSLKSTRRFIDILQSNIQRAYDFNLRSNSPFGNLPLLPPLRSNISLVVKTEI